MVTNKLVLRYLFKENLFIRGGFNFQRRFNNTLDSYAGLVGFSFGLGMKVSKFRINYSRSSYHLSGQINSFSISTALLTISYILAFFGFFLIFSGH